MKLRYVTITGADDNVHYDDMLSLYKQYPFIEWAILFGPNTGPRYPSDSWIKGLKDCVGMNLSAHLCGKWVSDAIKGNCVLPEEIHMFQRIQFNLGKDRLPKALRSAKFLDAISAIDKPVIMGGNYEGIAADYWFFMDHGICPLFDASGGQGILAEKWPFPLGESLLCGYAGGLDPKNLREQLKAIEAVVGHAEIWIDMETGVRTDNQLDFNKIKKVLKIARTWVVES